MNFADGYAQQAGDAQPKPKIAIIVASVLMVRYFLHPHIRMLSKHFEVTLLLKQDVVADPIDASLPVRIIPIPIERKISLFNDLKALIAIIRICRAEKFTCVHSFTPKGGLLGILGAFLARVPIRVHTFQGEVWVHDRGIRRGLFKALDWLIARLATHLTVVSRTEQAFLKAEGVLRGEKSRVLGAGSIGGVDVSRFSCDVQDRSANRLELGLSKTDIVFTYVGRLCADKGLLVLARAFKMLAETRNDVRLMIVGPDEDGTGAQLKAEFEILGDNKLIVRPATTSPEFELAATDVFVIPSVREGFGVVVIEAASMGIPALGSDIYGIQDAIVDGKTGQLFVLNDATDLFEKMRTLCDNPILRDSLGHAAKKRVYAHFTQTEIVGHFEQFYASLPFTPPPDIATRLKVGKHAQH